MSVGLLTNSRNWWHVHVLLQSIYELMYMFRWQQILHVQTIHSPAKVSHLIQLQLWVKHLWEERSVKDFCLRALRVISSQHWILSPSSLIKEGHIKDDAYHYCLSLATRMRRLTPFQQAVCKQAVEQAFFNAEFHIPAQPSSLSQPCQPVALPVCHPHLLPHHLHLLSYNFNT